MEPSRITINAKMNFGKPSIRNSRYTVAMVLELLASGINNAEIMEDYAFLEEEDIKACLIFASNLMNVNSIHKLVA